MLTSRGSWLAGVALVLAGVGVHTLDRSGPTAALLGTSVLVWMGVEYLRIARAALVAQRVGVKRELIQNGRATPVLWADATFIVRLTILSQHDLSGVTLADLRPTDLPPGEDYSVPLELIANVPTVIEYELMPSGPGVLRFEGATIRAGSELAAFASRVVLRDAAEWYVLPRPGRAGSPVRTIKRHNTMPPPGAHRLRRAGSGDELLDLRDYRPGDEPKMIAWKASARRDTLITREIETDVPVRAVLLVDASASARAGEPGRTAAARLAALALAVVRDALNARDPVGIAILGDENFRYTTPSRGRRHEHDLARLLTTASAELTPPVLTPEGALRQGMALARRVYPDLLEPTRNSTPVSLFWRPIADSRKLWLVVAILSIIPLLMTFARTETLDNAAFVADALAPTGWAWLGLLLMAMTPGVIAGLIWLTHGAFGLLPHARRRVAGAKRLGLILSLPSGNPVGIERLITDDAELIARVARFVSAHRVRLPGAPARPLDPRVAAKALTAAVGRARDNELYALFCDGLRRDGVADLVQAVRVARARRHQVVVFAPLGRDPITAPVPSAEELRQGHDAKASGDRWRRELARAGANVVELHPAEVAATVRLKLDELRRGRRGTRR